MNLKVTLTHEQWRQYKRSEDETTRAARLHFEQRLAAYEPRHTSEDPVKLEMAVSPDDSAILPLLRSMQDALHRFPVSAIKGVGDGAKTRGVPVDSACLLFIDAAFYEDLLDAFNWDASNATRPGDSEWAYYDRVAMRIGNRFGFSSASDDADHDFQGDGEYVLDVKAIERVS